MSERQPTATETTVIGRGIHVNGELTGAAPIDVWGELEGVGGTEATLRIREGGRVKGELAAAQVIVEGRVEGNISAEHKIELKSSCHVEGDIASRTVAVAEGAYFEGRVKMTGRSGA